jgi:hypothetical protein
MTEKENKLTGLDIQYITVARDYGVSPDIIRALVAAEALSEAFDERGNIRIYYDRVEFLNQYRQVRLIEERQKNKNGEDDVHEVVRKELDEMSKTYAQVMNPQPVEHKDNWREWKDYKNAIVFSTECAQRATRWGRFLIPGYLARMIGYSSTDQMVKEFSSSEENQLIGFNRYLRFDPRLARSVRNKDWRLFVEVFPSVKGEDQSTRLKRLQDAMSGLK